MHVLMITDGIYPFVVGGLQKHSYYIGRYLTQQGIRVTLAHCPTSGERVDERSMDAFADFDHDLISFKHYPFPTGDRLPGHYVRDNKRYSQAMYNDLKDGLDQYDLIYCKGFTAWAFIKAAQKGAIKIPILSKLHGYEMFQRPPSLRVKFEQPLLRPIAKYVSVGADYVCSYGGKITQLVRDLGLPDHRILECPTGVGSHWLKAGEATPPGEQRKFVFVGRNERRKGIFELSEALQALIKERGETFEFHFIGDIPPEQQVKAANIIYHGKMVGDEKIQAIHRGCDILVCPSYSEGMPNVIMEGMASGMAVIATDVGAVVAQIDDNGWLLPNAQVATIKKALSSALDLPADTLLHYKNQSLKHVREKFLWEKVIERKIACFDHAIQHYPVNA